MLGVDAKIVIETTRGRAFSGRVFLDDGLSEATFTASRGLNSNNLTIFLPLKKIGVWKLGVSAKDGCGATDETALSRQITVR